MDIFYLITKFWIYSEKISLPAKISIHQAMYQAFKIKKRCSFLLTRFSHFGSIQVVVQDQFSTRKSSQYFGWYKNRSRFLVVFIWTSLEIICCNASFTQKFYPKTNSIDLLQNCDPIFNQQNIHLFSKISIKKNFLANIISLGKFKKIAD